MRRRRPSRPPLLRLLLILVLMLVAMLRVEARVADYQGQPNPGRILALRSGSGEAWVHLLGWRWRIDTTRVKATPSQLREGVQGLWGRVSARLAAPERSNP